MQSSSSVTLATNDVPLLEPQRLVRSLEQHRAQFGSLDAEQLVSISIDIAAPAMLVLKRWPSWKLLLPRMEKLSHEVDIDSIRNLETYAEATLQANSEYLTSVAPPSDLNDKLLEAEALRTALREDCDVLLRRRLLPVGSLDEVKGYSGYRNVAVDLTSLANVLVTYEGAITGKTGISREEVDRASVLAQYIFRNAVERDARQPHQTAATLLRQQAFTTLFRAYEEFRHCVAFLYRVSEEAERIAPSFYQGRGGRPSESATPPSGEQLSDAGASATDPSASSGVTSQGHPSAVVPPAVANPNALPSTNPFSS